MTDQAGLSGIRVVDFGQWLAAPLAAMMLADFGADVIRVEPPGGPHWDHPANATLQRNKRSITLNLHDAEDVSFAHDLIATADVVIEGFRPGVMARLGLDPVQLCAAHPHLIWCSVPGFGEDDPRAGLPAWEGVVCSAASLYPPRMFAFSGGPRFCALPYASNFGAFIAAHSIVAALIARQRGGRGDRIEIPLFDAAMEAIAINLENPPSDPFDRVAKSMHGAAVANLADHKLYKCRDGRFLRRDIPLRGLHALWDRFMPAGLKDDTSPQGAERAERLLTELFLTKDAREWEDIGQRELRAAFATHQTTREWLHDDHAHDSGSVVTVEDPLLGTTQQAGFGVRVGNCPPQVRFARRLPGADNVEVREEVARLLTEKPLRGDQSVARPGEGELPLAGIRVLDFTSLVAGPGASRILAEYGAEVIKISKTGLATGNINPVSDEPGMYAGHRTTGAGKKTMFLDLRSEQGRSIALDLAATADVVCINFARDIVDEMGVGERRLREVAPDLIYSTVNVHGKGGWREFHRGHEQLGQTVTGITIRFGGPETPEELPILVNDYGTPHLSALGMLVALFHRFRGGGGNTVESALSRTSTVSQIPFMIDYEGCVLTEPSGKDVMGWDAYDRLYRCADGWLYIAAIGDAKARLRSVEGLSQAWEGGDDAAEPKLEQCFLEDRRDQWLARLRAADIPVHCYHDLDELLEQSLLRERRLVVTKEHPGMSSGQVMGIAARFASRPDRQLPGASMLGWHTFAILEEMGFDRERIDQLVAAQVVAGPMSRESQGAALQNADTNE